MAITSSRLGVLPEGGAATMYCLENRAGIRVGILDYGAAIHSLEVPTGKGKSVDVALGHAGITGYLSNRENMGVVVGRNANRVAGARARIGAATYELDANDGENNLHSGPNGLAHRLFAAEPGSRGGSPALLLSLVVPHRGDGFPGELHMSVTYTLTDDNALRIEYAARADRDTVFNPTNHCYFNLAGHISGTIRDHLAEVDADMYTPYRPDKIPTGEIRFVKGTPYDFTNAKSLGKDIYADHPDMRRFGGYDVNLVLNGSGWRRAALLTEPKSGRTMEVSTDLPALQLFTGNSLNPAIPRKGGGRYGPHQGVCFEAQFFPNAVNVPWFPQPILPAGVTLSRASAYRFAGF